MIVVYQIINLRTLRFYIGSTGDSRLRYGRLEPNWTKHHNRVVWGWDTTGILVSLETRAKISVSKIGNTYRKGTTMTSETRAKQSAAHINVPLSPTHRKNVVAALRKPEIRAKISKSLTGKKQSSETIAKRVAKLTGKTRSKEQRVNIAKGMTIAKKRRKKIYEYFGPRYFNSLRWYLHFR